MDKNSARKTAKVATEATVGTVSGIFRTIFKVFATILLIIITTGLLFTCIFAYYVKTNLTQDLGISLENIKVNLTSTIYYTDDNGQSHELAQLHGQQNRVWVDYENIPKYMEHAAVAIEDKRFYDHKGVDWYRTVAAFGNMFLSMKNDFGGSTLTQQLIKNITQEDDITVQRKLMEIFRALDFERMYTKEDIVEGYLNIIFLGEGCYGVGSAAQAYFDKDVWDLSLAECASIIGITNNPSKYDPYISRENNKERTLIILSEMYNQGYVTYDEYTEASAIVSNDELVFKRAENEEYEMIINSYYVDTVIADVKRDLMEEKDINEERANDLIYSGGLQIYCCMNPTAQALVDSIYNDPAQFPSAKAPNGESLQSGAVVMDPYTGEVLAIAGGVGQKTGNLIFNYAVDAKRPPGSSIKPIATYGPAIDQGLISPDTRVKDAGKDEIQLKGTTWLPYNAGGGYMGVVTIRTALINSLNTVSAQILDKLSPEVSYDYLTTHLGFTSLVPEDCNYAPLALGQLTNGCTVREMCQAYTAFVNDGVFTYARTYTHILDSEGKPVLDNPPDTIVAFKANTAWTITSMLQDAARGGTGYESNLGNLMPNAGKTGSSTDYCDRWFVGYTPYYVCAVWTGYDTPSRMYVSGNPSAQTWKKIMAPLNEGLPYKTFKSPQYIGPTDIFGDLEETPTPSPEESEIPSEAPTGEQSPSGSSAPGSGTDITTPTPTPPTPSLPVTSPSVPPTESQVPLSPAA